MRPADIAQRNGRMVRQGNMNKEVSIFIYVTESTFDSYSWQLVENKQKFISQIMTSNPQPAAARIWTKLRSPMPKSRLWQRVTP
mgnify:FL=1